MHNKKFEPSLLKKAAQIQLLLTDCDGVLTDAGVYYTAHGEEMKRFSMRDGMGVERLRKLAKVEVGIVTGENSLPVSRRAAKLQITELHLSCKDKPRTLHAISERENIPLSQIAYIGDDYNDEAVLQIVGLSACPSDAMEEIKGMVHYCCQNKGGHGAFREFAELIIHAKSLTDNGLEVLANGSSVERFSIDVNDVEHNTVT